MERPLVDFSSNHSPEVILFFSGSFLVQVILKVLSMDELEFLEA